MVKYVHAIGLLTFRLRIYSLHSDNDCVPSKLFIIAFGIPPPGFRCKQASLATTVGLDRDKFNI
jgi:hypothetical protein